MWNWLLDHYQLQTNVRINGIQPGDIVQHKISKRRGVMRGVFIDDHEWWAVVATDIYRQDEFNVPIVEVELVPVESATSAGAVDPHASAEGADSTGTPPTRA